MDVSTEYPPAATVTLILSDLSPGSLFFWNIELDAEVKMTTNEGTYVYLCDGSQYDKEQVPNVGYVMGDSRAPEIVRRDTPVVKAQGRIVLTRRSSVGATDALIRQKATT